MVERRQAEKLLLFSHVKQKAQVARLQIERRSSNAGMLLPRGTTTRIRKRNRAIRCAPGVRMSSVKTDFYGGMGT